METSKAKHLAINLEIEERAVGNGMSCSRGIREGCVKGVTSSLGLEGEVESHAADKGPHLGVLLVGKKKSFSLQKREALEVTYYSGKGPFGSPIRCPLTVG